MCLYSSFIFLVCTFYGWSGGFFGLLSINTMAAIALDRYLVIVRHRGPTRHISITHAVLMIIFAWLYALLWSIGPVLGWNRYIPEGLGTTCSYDYLTRNVNYTSLIVSMIVGGFVFPLGIIVWCYMSIFTIVISQTRFFSKTSKELHAKALRGGGKRSKRTEYKIAKSMLTVVILFCLSWSPYVILSCIGQFGQRSLITPLASAIPGLLAKASTMYNPFVYIIGHPRFKRKIPCVCVIQFSVNDRSGPTDTYSASGSTGSANNTTNGSRTPRSSFHQQRRRSRDGSFNKPRSSAYYRKLPVDNEAEVGSEYAQLEALIQQIREDKKRNIGYDKIAKLLQLCESPSESSPPVTAEIEEIPLTALESSCNGSNDTTRNGDDKSIDVSSSRRDRSVKPTSSIAQISCDANVHEEDMNGSHGMKSRNSDLRLVTEIKRSASSSSYTRLTSVDNI